MGLPRGVRESDLVLPKAVPTICIFFILLSALLSACRADVQSIDPGLQGEYGSTPELTRHPTGTFSFISLFIYLVYIREPINPELRYLFIIWIFIYSISGLHT